MTRNVFVETFPAASVAVTVTTVVPIAKNEPDGIEYVIFTALTASVATAGGYVTIAPCAAPVVARAKTVMSAGTNVNTGGVVSRTVIVNVWLVTFPCPSRAVTVTTVVPSLNIVPDAWEYVIVTGPTASVAFANA